MEALKAQIEAAGHVVGSFVNTASPICAEIMARAGFDFLAVDAEHSPVDVPQAFSLFQAITAGNPQCAPLLRLPHTGWAEIKRYMDAGAAGVIAPLVKTRTQAEEVVDAVKYPPQGKRGVDYCRSNGYGAELAEHVQTDNERTFVCVQVEHVDAVSNLSDILSVPGVDAVLVGPYDLSASMGLTAQFEHTDVVEAIKHVHHTCRAKGIVSGLHVVQPDPKVLAARVREGYGLLSFGLDITFLTNACRQGLAGIREELDANA